MDGKSSAPYFSVQKKIYLSWYWNVSYHIFDFYQLYTIAHTLPYTIANASKVMLKMLGMDGKRLVSYFLCTEEKMPFLTLKYFLP